MDGYETTLRVALIDDSEDDRQRILGMIADSAVPCKVTTYNNAESFLEAYRPRSYDLLIVDIFMSELSGIDCMEKVRRMDPTVAVAFQTSSQDHALSSYRLDAIKYLEKPVDGKEVRRLLALVFEHKTNIDCICVMQGGKEMRIPISDILYLEQEKRQVHIHLLNGEDVTIYDKISSYIPSLETEGFWSGHKSFLVNLSQVQYIDESCRAFSLIDESKIPIRRTSMSKAKAMFKEYLIQDRLP